MSTLTLSDYVELERARRLADALFWTEDGDGHPQDAGDVGGDAQLDGSSLSRAFWAELPNGLHARVEIAFFIGEAPERRHSDTPADEDKSLHQQIEYLICADRNDPGGTEINAEYTYNDDVAPQLRATDSNVLDLCLRLGLDDAAWPIHESRVLRLLTHGLPPVTALARSVGGTTRRLFIGGAVIGAVTSVPTDAGERHVACAHDWDNGEGVPLAVTSPEPGPEYDPMLIGTFEDYDEALRNVVTRVPPRLSRSLYTAATEETPPA